MSQTIADRLRGALADAGISAEQAAAAFADGGHPNPDSTVQRILCGDRQPSAFDVALIAELAGADAMELITGETDLLRVQVIGPCRMPDWAAGD